MSPIRSLILQEACTTSSEFSGDRSTSTKALQSVSKVVRERESKMLTLLSHLCFLLLSMEVVHAEEGRKHAGCYYGVWAYARPGLGQFWPEDIDFQLCDVIYYGFGNVLKMTHSKCAPGILGSTWAHQILVS